MGGGQEGGGCYWQLLLEYLEYVNIRDIIWAGGVEHISKHQEHMQRHSNHYVLYLFHLNHTITLYM